MKRIAFSISGGVFIFLAMLMFGAPQLAQAQEEKPDSGATTPPKVMEIVREFVKPGKSGAAHERAESAFVQAFARAKWPTHYIAATSVTGKPRVLFFVGYDSFDAWEKDSVAQQKNATLSAALDRAAVNDGDLLADMDTHLLQYDEEQSLNVPVDIAHMKYIEVLLYRVRPGHRQQWEEIMKLVKEAYGKNPDMHWAAYDVVYGQEATSYLFLLPMKSAKDIDEGNERDKKFVEAMGEEGMKKLAELESAAVESSSSNLFQMAPSMSYPPDAWVKANPEFWKSKPMSKPMAKPKSE